MLRMGLIVALCAAYTLAQTCSANKIYDGGLVWGLWGWDTTIVQANTAYQYNNKPSICWTTSAFNGMYFHVPSGTLVSSTYGYLHFWVNGISGGQSQRVEFYYNGAIIGSYLMVTAYTSGSMPTTWTEVKIPIADFGLAAGQLIDGVTFQGTGTALQNLLCYAAITLECGSAGTAAPTPSPPPSTFAGTKNSPNGPYTVSGNKILDKDGQEHIFRGWARPSLEWLSTGENMNVADYTLQANTGSNVMRISLNQNFWLVGGNKYDSTYQARIQTVVTQSKAAGMTVILDLHWSNKGNLGTEAGQQVMADAYSVTFWSQVAAIFKNDPEVLFELYNEPHTVPCDVWMNGGGPGTWGFTVAGMQQMYDAVRATGANNLVVVGGLNYAYDLTCVKTYPLAGTNVVYNTHPYFNYPPKGTPTVFLYGACKSLQADWNTYFGFLLPNFPVMATEFGLYDCSTPDYVTWLAYCTTNKIHWAGWAWYPGGCGFPGLISAWSGALTDPGQLVVNALIANRPAVSTTSANSAVATTASAASVSTSSAATTTSATTAAVVAAANAATSSTAAVTSNAATAQATSTASTTRAVTSNAATVAAASVAASSTSTTNVASIAAAAAVANAASNAAVTSSTAAVTSNAVTASTTTRAVTAASATVAAVTSAATSSTAVSAASVAATISASASSVAQTTAVSVAALNTASSTTIVASNSAASTAVTTSASTASVATTTSASATSASTAAATNAVSSSSTLAATIATAATVSATTQASASVTAASVTSAAASSTNVVSTSSTASVAASTVASSTTSVSSINAVTAAASTNTVAASLGSVTGQSSTTSFASTAVIAATTSTAADASTNAALSSTVSSTSAVVSSTNAASTGAGAGSATGTLATSTTSFSSTANAATTALASSTTSLASGSASTSANNNVETIDIATATVTSSTGTAPTTDLATGSPTAATGTTQQPTGASSTKKGKSNHALGIGPIVGIVVGAAVLVAIIVIVLVVVIVKCSSAPPASNYMLQL